MRWVHISFDDPSALDLNWMWLPAFIGQDHRMLQQLREELMEVFGGRPIQNETMAKIHHFVLDWFDRKYHIKGLRKYLEAVIHVEQEA